MADPTTQDTGTATTDAGGVQTADTTATASAAPADAQPNAEGAKPEAQKPAEVEYKFEAPEGVELDASQVDQFKALAKELNLPADKAKAIADIAIKAEVERREAFAKQVTKWGEELQADKELGNPEALAAMRSVVDKFGGDELKSMLNATGMGNHPVVARFIHNISKAMSEDRIVGKQAGEAPAPDAASVLYPTHSKA